MDERKSWKRLIFAYAGAGVLVLVIGFFIARGASTNPMIVAHAGSTPTPTVVGVYSGIAPDATPAPPAATDSPTPAPSPTSTPTAGPHASPVASEKPEKKIADGSEAKKHAKPHHPKVQLVADVAAADRSGSQNHIVPIVHPNADQPEQAKPVPTVTVETATEAPAPPPVATAAPDTSEPVFAPQRIVDAQVRVAVQPEYSDTDRERGAHGTSVVLVTIDPKGRVVNTVVGTSSGYSSLDRAAVAAARSSEFVAPKINGRPATETYRVVYDFSP